MTERQSENRGLEIVQDVLDGKKSILEAAVGLLSLLQVKPSLASRDDFNLIRAIESETDDLPIGRIREHWHPDALTEKDREIERLEGLWREQMLAACERIRRALLVRKLVLSQHLNVADQVVCKPLVEHFLEKKD